VVYRGPALIPISIPCLALALACCGPAPDAARLTLGGLSVRCDPPDAVLFVDDKYMGTVGSLKGRAVKLPEGVHRIEVRREGYFSHFAEVKVAKGVRQKLEVALRKEPF
jgi:hypothetical protein